MISLRKASSRGHVQHGWLESWHSFSFADYYDPANTRFGALRVINEDIVQPGTGFDTHGHRDMEILTYVLSGTLRHRDSMGNGGDLRYGDIQVMSAGLGVQHSEVNPSQDEAVHLLQIWILPERQGLKPGYSQKHFPVQDKLGRWCLLASPDAEQGSLAIHQGVRVLAAKLDGAQELEYRLAAGRKAYLHIARGSLQANGHALSAGDALTYVEEDRIALGGAQEAEVLLFDLA
ncbi:MAG: pirin family protein [Gallionellaceae bacterium]|nr:pirin family protein [Gallionellaceae bacterium]